MKEKKKAKNWYIAATHYLIAGFVVPFLGTITFITIIDSLLPMFGITMPIMFWSVEEFVRTIYLLPFVYFGVLYSSKFIKKRYFIQNANKIIRLSAIYAVVSVLVFNALIYMFPDGYTVTALFLTMNISAQLMLVAIFYFTSKKFIKEKV